MRSQPRYACAFCPAKRVTVPGIESHVRHIHPDQYQQAIEDHTTVVFDVLR